MSVALLLMAFSGIVDLARIDHCHIRHLHHFRSDSTSLCQGRESLLTSRKSQISTDFGESTIPDLPMSPDLFISLDLTSSFVRRSATCQKAVAVIQRCVLLIASSGSVLSSHSQATSSVLFKGK